MDQQKSDTNDKPEKEDRNTKRNSISSAIGFGCILLILGVLVILADQRILDWDELWMYLLLGIGVVLLGESIFQLIKGGTWGIKMRTIVPGLILTGISIVYIAGSDHWWPVVIIVVGIAVILGAIIRNSQKKQ